MLKTTIRITIGATLKLKNINNPSDCKINRVNALLRKIAGILQLKVINNILNDLVPPHEHRNLI